MLNLLRYRNIKQQISSYQIILGSWTWKRSDSCIRQCSIISVYSFEKINSNKFNFSFSIRYAMVIDDNKVKKVLVEPDGTGLTCSLSQNLLDVIKKHDLAKWILP